MPLDLLKEEQAQLTAELERIERQLDAYRADMTATRHVMETVLDLMQDCSRLYSAAPAHLKKQLNQVFFERVLVNPRVDDDGAVIVPDTSPSQSDSSNAADDVSQVSDQAERQHTDVASPCMSDEQAVWSVPKDGGEGDLTTERAAMVCPPSLPRMTSGSNGTTLTACLRFPFTYLASPALRRAAERDAARLNKQKTGAQPHQQNTPIPANKHSPRHNLPHEAVPLGCCSYTRVLVHLGSINSNNWLPLLAFRKRLIAGEMAPEPSTASVAPTATASETTTARGIRNAACRPISAAKKEQILRLEPTGMSAREIAAEVGVTESTVRATCRQAKRAPRRKRHFTSDDLQRAQQLHAQGRTYIEIGLELGFGRDTVSKHLMAAQE